MTSLHGLVVIVLSCSMLAACSTSHPPARPPESTASIHADQNPSESVIAETDPPSAVSHPPGEPESVDDYQMLVKRLQSGDLTVDFRKLRESFTQTKLFNPYDDDLGDTSTDMLKALDEKRFEDAISAADRLLDLNYTAILPHIISAICWNELGNSEKERFHGEIVKGLVRSITDSGDGSEARPYRIIRIQEEYDLLNVMGLELESQALITSGSSMLDQMTVIDSTTKDKKQIYFNVDICFAFWEKQLPVESGDPGNARN